MKILIVDDQPANRILLGKLLTQTAEQLLFAENGQEAVDIFQQELPDLVLMDIMMPIMDGNEAIKIIRSIKTEKRPQIIIISALGDESNVVKGLDAGADDYVSKPFNARIVKAKVFALLRMLTMQNTLLENKQKLQVYQRNNEKELNFAKGIFEKIIARNKLKDERLDYWIEPSKMFSGDLISIKHTSGSQVYFMLADATGHGLAAALPTIIVNQIFQAMSQKRISISTIVREINSRLKQDIPVGYFVALAVGIIDSENKTMEIWNGGLPPLFVLNKNTEVIHQFPATHTACGVMTDQEFDSSTDIWHWTEKSELFVYSDGLTDVVDEQGQVFGEKQLMNALLQTIDGHRIQGIKDVVAQYLDPDKEQDDISCLVIYCE